MISHFEARLADVLGSRLAAPFAGRVEVAPGPPPSNDPDVLVAVVEAVPLAADFGRVRPELTPGAGDPRRVVRLDCSVEVGVRAGAAAGREQVLAGLDAVLYELEHPDMRRAGTLTSPADDPGFLLESLYVRRVATAPAEGFAHVAATAVGWFWPPNVPGETGEPIVEARVRVAGLPVLLSPWPLLLRAGDQEITLTLEAHAVGTMVLDGTTVTGEDFGALAVRVVDDGGRPGAGVLTGGTAGPSETRVLTFEGGQTTLGYTPPAESAIDHLVVAVAHPDTGDGAAIGVELARFSLVVN